MSGVREVTVIPLGTHPRDVSLEELRSGIEQILPVRITIRPRPVDIDSALDASRKQYHSTSVLALLLQQAEPHTERLLGITPYDLFVPVLTFVFGQAQLNNLAAVFSTFRLHNEFYGIPRSGEQLAARCLKEALHELGHTFGLRHCIDHPCVMNSSTYVEDIDLKPADFCLPCREHLEIVL
ncbi:MAG: archaemetzincin family Zn-dependent metalloprotease [Bacteroidetes bacterium]|nr:archaemetzincin family Zn-dependent metalloprotease [Bacteroidota bacterium]